jgi:Transmembrane amino acid transporter protein
MLSQTPASVVCGVFVRGQLNSVSCATCLHPSRHTRVQVVALCNTYTCHLLLSAALATRTSTFEELCEAVGGRYFKVFAQLSNVVLLTGNLTGDICLLADLGFKSLTGTLGDRAPLVLTRHHGRGIMLVLTASVIVPVSLCRGMRAMEHVSSGGLFILAALLAVLTGDAIVGGFRGVTSGEVPIWWLPADSSSVPEAFALLGTANLLADAWGAASV